MVSPLWPFRQAVAEPQTINAHCAPMVMGHRASDWTVRNIGGEGTVRCAGHYGRFKVRRDGIVKIFWQLGKEPGPDDSGPVNQAAQEAIAAVLWR